MNKLCNCDNCVRTREKGYQPCKTQPCEKPATQRPYLGDTPEQLGSFLVADAVMIDGRVITNQQVREMKEDLDFFLEQSYIIEHMQDHEKMRRLRKKYGMSY